MKIKSMQLENYRCFDNLKLNIDKQLTVLVGVNGSGKTTVLDALGLFLGMYAQNFYLGANRNKISETDLRHGMNQAKLSCTIDLDNTEISPSITLTREVSTPQVDLIRNDAGLLRLNKGKAKYGYKHSIVAYYSGRRDLDRADRGSISQSSLKSAYAGAFMPRISFSSSLAWFIEKSTQEALEARQKKDMEHTLPDLSAVREAISKALGEYGEPYIGETPPALFIPQKNDSDQVFRIEELSDGYRTMLALVMDLARRMAIANAHIEQWPDGQTVLYSPGVVLIDEVELHLHPSWQQTVLPTLMNIFPNVQFIVTTHSPQILTSIAAKHICILKGNSALTMPEETEGADAARVLEDVLGVNPRPLANVYAQKLQQYADMVYKEEWDKPEAKGLQTELEEHYGDAEPKLKELELHIENSKWEREL